MRKTASTSPRKWDPPQADEFVFESEFEAGFERTVRFLHSRGATGDVAEEIAQAAWVRGWERRNQLQSSESVVSWVNGIAKNMFRNMARTIYRTVPLNITQGPCSNAHCGHKTLELECQVDIQRVLEGEDKRDGLILRLFYEEGYDTREIATKLGLSAVAVRIRLCRLRRRIRDMLGFSMLMEA
ncbi:RNA polymerase sigma factor [Paludibaculum fermentans]|uniref:RNA polymerase sigma factor n=1 Tax=Paludibaculum fermentans TaxID=1473598 RepID=UPI003EBD6D2C